LKEHYGIEVPVSSIRAPTEEHGETIKQHTTMETYIPDRPGVAQLIVELDGSMIPEVQIGEARTAKNRWTGANGASSNGRKRGCVWRMNPGRCDIWMQPGGLGRPAGKPEPKC